jgi:hypothetical protein
MEKKLAYFDRKGRVLSQVMGNVFFHGGGREKRAMRRNDLKLKFDMNTK